MGAAPVSAVGGVGVGVVGGADPPPTSASSPPPAPPAPSPAPVSPEGCGPVPPVGEADVFPDRVLPGDLRPAVGSTGMPPAGGDSSDDQRSLSKRSRRARSVSPPRGWAAECEVVDDDVIEGPVWPPVAPMAPAAGASPSWEVAPSDRDLVVVLTKTVRREASDPVPGGRGPGRCVFPVVSPGVKNRVAISTNLCGYPCPSPGARNPRAAPFPVVPANGVPLDALQALELTVDSWVYPAPWCSYTIWVPRVQCFVYGVPELMPQPCASPGRPVSDDVKLVWEAYCLRFPKREFPDKYA
ncbi:uncharacterized protein [Procambarus clarkii]|uniref:uncharacterized protein n=1 Tax=Procambarus clarkii TaxID=6728 RepID=UPI00374409C0